MSGNEAGGLKKDRSRFLYVPLTLRVILSSIPFLVLGIWYISWIISEMSYYDAGLIWIETVQTVEKEVFRFNERLEDEELQKLDLRADYQEKALPEYEQDAYAEFSNRIAIVDPEEDSGDIQIQYVYYGNDGSLMSLDAEQREQSVVPEDTDFYKYAVQALEEKTTQKTLMKCFYRSEGRDYYVCIARINPAKPVCCGNVLLSDGTKGSNMLITGRFCYALTERRAGAARWKQYFAFTFVFILIIGFICIVIKRSLARLMKFIGIMQNAVDEELDFTDIDLSRVNKGASDEIRELLENFQLMILSIREYRKTKLNIRELYDSLLPAALLALFGHEDIRSIKPGDSAAARGTVLSIRLISSKNDVMADIEGRNRLIVQILNIFESMNMIVTELEYDRITALLIQEDGKNKKDNFDEEIKTIRSLYREGSGVNRIVVSKQKGEFRFTVTGITGYMKIRMEQISDKQSDNINVEEI